MVGASGANQDLHKRDKAPSVSPRAQGWRRKQKVIKGQHPWKGLICRVIKNNHQICLPWDCVIIFYYSRSHRSADKRFCREDPVSCHGRYWLGLRVGAVNGTASNGAVEFSLSDCVHELLGNYIYSGTWWVSWRGKLLPVFLWQSITLFSVCVSLPPFNCLLLTHISNLPHFHPPESCIQFKYNVSALVPFFFLFSVS